MMENTAWAIQQKTKKNAPKAIYQVRWVLPSFLAFYLLLTFATFRRKSPLIGKAELEGLTGGIIPSKPQSSHSDNCTWNASLPAPIYDSSEVTITKHRRATEAVKVVSYIIEKLSMKDDADAPFVAPMFGTLLREYRNGTGPCLLYDLADKDFDIVVNEAHFKDIIMMRHEIREKFGWSTFTKVKKHLFLKILPPPTSATGKEKKFHLFNQDMYQIDVYGFRLNSPSKGMIHFPWEGVTISTDMFLPLVKYKQTAPSSDGHLLNDQLSSHNNASSQAYFYMPYNTECILRNMYGADFMTPKGYVKTQTPKGFAKDEKAWTMNRSANDTSLCKDKKMSEHELSEFKRQIAAWS